MTTSKPRAFHHGNLRAALLDASLQLLDQGGADAVTIRAVARKTGVSHAAPVNHFNDREALLTALCTLLFEELGGAIECLRQARSEDPAGRVLAFAEGMIDYGLTQPHRYRLLWRRDLVNNDDENLQQAMDTIYDALTTEIGKLIDERDHDPHTAAIALWSVAHGYVSMRLDGNFQEMRDSISEKKRERAIIDLLMQSITP